MGARITVNLPGSTPDPKRVSELEKETLALENRIRELQVESSKYEGGLIKAMHESGIATARMSLEILKLEILKAKYGIHWFPSLGDKVADERQKRLQSKSAGGGEWRQQVSIAQPDDSQGASLLSPILSNKRFHKSDWRSGSYEDTITFDITWDTSGLRRPARAVKGVLVFADLFGEPKFRIRVTIDTPLTPGKALKQTGIGFKYNQFTTEHQWVRSTDLVNMTFQFETQEVLYQDGKAEKFSHYQGADGGREKR